MLDLQLQWTILDEIGCSRSEDGKRGCVMHASAILAGHWIELWSFVLPNLNLPLPFSFAKERKPVKRGFCRFSCQALNLKNKVVSSRTATYMIFMFSLAFMIAQP